MKPSICAEQQAVILLHGLVRTGRSMKLLEAALIKQGFSVENLSYESKSQPIEELAESVIGQALKLYGGMSKVHFVTHSLGGILVRQYLAKHEIKNLGRVVMLGPPNHGSEVVDKLKEYPGFHFINGDAGMQLGTGAASVPNKLGEANFDLGVIAGTRSINLLFSQLIPGKNDGKVSVASTKVEGMKDHLEMAVTHPFMMRNTKVIKQVICYLQSGKFDRD